MFIQQQPSRQPYLQPKLNLHQQHIPNHFTQQYFTQQLRIQPNIQNQQPRQDLISSIPFAKSIQYEVQKQPLQQQTNFDSKKHSSEMVTLIKESQELKKNINDRDQEILKSKQNIERLEQLIDYLEKQSSEQQQQEQQQQQQQQQQDEEVQQY